MRDRVDSDCHPGEYASISIVVTTFNEEENIRDCLSSLVRLDYPKDNWEIMVVDCSTDCTPEIVAGYRGVRLIRSRKGFATQKNVGLNGSTFDILLYTDADCVVSENWLRIVNQAFKNKNIAAIGGNAYPPPGTGRFGRWVACVGHPAGGAIGLDGNIRRTENGVDFIPGCNAAYRRSVLLDLGGFNKSFNDGGEDVEICRRMKQRGYYLDYVSQLTVYHKPRSSLFKYIEWNLRVGITKFNLEKPCLTELIFRPSFLLWPILLFWGVLFLVKIPVFVPGILCSLWLFSIIVLLVFAKPYPLLIKRRKKIGVSPLSILTVIPFLIYLRQLCINLGEIKKWLEVRRNHTSLSSG